jgi:hypothetical protein
MFTFHRMSTRCLLAGLLLPSLAVATRAEAQSGADLAVQLIERSGLQRGICVVLGDDRSLAVEIAKASELQVHCRQPNAEVVTRLRSEADTAGLDIHHVAIDHGPLNPLPYADNVVDLLIAPVGLSEDL